MERKRVVRPGESLTRRIRQQGDPGLRGKRGPQQTARLIDAIVNGSEECLYILDPQRDFRVVFANEATCRHFGYSREQLLEMGPRDWDLTFTPEQGRARWTSRTDPALVFETIHRRADGTTVPVEVRLGPLQLDGVEYALGSLRDTTAQKRAEAEAQHSRSLLLAALESTADGILVVDTNGRISAYNQRFASMWGVPESVLQAGDGDRALHHILDQLRDPGAFIERVQELYREPWSEDFDVISFKDGRVFERYSRPQVVDGAPVGRVWSFRDVTSRVRAEEALRLRAAALDTAANAIVIMDAEGTIEWVNAGWTALTGYTAEEAIGQNLRHLKALEDNHETIDAARWKRIREGKVWHAEVEEQRRDGTRFVKEETITPLLDEDGRPSHFIGIKRDVTDRKRIEQALHDSEDRYRDLVEHSTDLICTHDLDGRLLSVNAAAERLLGYPPEALRRKNLRDLLVPEARSRFDTYLDTIRQHGAASGLMHVQTAAGEKRFWEYDNTLRTEGVATPIVRGIGRDVTERRIAEEALRDSEERLRLAVEATGQGLIDVDLQSGVATVTPEFAAMMEYGREETQSSWDELLALVHPDDRERARAAVRDHIEGRIPSYRAEFRMRTRSGTWKWHLAYGSIVQRDGEGRPRRLLAVHLDTTELKDAESEVAREATRRRVLFEQAADGIAVLDSEGRLREANASFARMVGYEMHELPALRLSQWDDACSGRPDCVGWVYPDVPTIVETTLRRKDGSTLPVEVSYTPTEWSGEKLMFYVCRDLTQRKRAEAEQATLQAQLVQAQKMESVGRLAGGIAHDFNNLLTAILGYSDLALNRVEDEELRADLEEIQQAGRRSADLTQRLLAFSRQQAAAPRVLDLNESVAGMLKMLQRLIGEDIDLAWRPVPDLGAVTIDPAQVDSILANLCVNARDAIAGVGRVTIETRNAAFDSTYCAEHRGFVPGEYAMLAVTDDGCGMTNEVLAHVFEPFYTTKAPGEGTGLGLATVYGIVKQNNGFINVYSEPGSGTTFKIYLPRASGATAPHHQADPESREGHGETVLLVEDAAAILRLGKTILEGLGYAVLTARRPSEALRVAAGHEGSIDLLVTDVVLPEMNGRELAERLQSARPGIRCLFVSGYTANVIAHRGLLEEGVHFLQKPFSRGGLATKVHEVLSDK